MTARLAVVAPDPAEDVPCCPTCSSNVVEITEGWTSGLWECARVERQACDRYLRFDELAWRA